MIHGLSEFIPVSAMTVQLWCNSDTIIYVSYSIARKERMCYNFLKEIKENSA